ncbi:aspartate aminotransferase family protein [Paenibacillus tritici]|uniref:Aspartate aminotransferase family protein n=1 Tax=Paenibacillus tritici TaxID=1873425 RepID=A0ABX2DTT9_9BACL|nr:aminotransferase class III-fold pyridoxal phosphate-dependent enzyme [Paenibacillus tritici]NQX47567.1 aspartate aminotransferase family protein [Paenibacillus tritici]
MLLVEKELYPFVHPLKPIMAGNELPSQIEGNGIYLKDNTGKICIDGISGLWNVSLGYRHPEIIKAITNQLHQLPFVNLVDNTNPTTLKYAKRLLELLPASLNKVVYTCTGSESVEVAIKLARKYYALRGNREKKEIVSFASSYHGTYYGSMSASGIDRSISEDYGPKVPGFIFIPVPFSNNRASGCSIEEHILNLEVLFEESGDRLAGFMMEPILGSAGVIPVPEKYMQKAKALCEEYDVLLILDEVATGFGRTGIMFAHEQYKVIPDILCLSKGINSGYLPLGATVLSNRIYEAFASTNSHIEHLSTQNGNPIACAAAIATLDVIKNESLLSKVELNGNLLKALINEALGKHKNFHEVRGQGMMIGVSLVKSKSTYECLNMGQIMQITHKLWKNGLLVYPFYTESLTAGFHIIPPFVITPDEISKIVQIIRRVLDRTVF